MKVVIRIVGIIAAVILYLFAMEIKDELEEERKWREKGKR